MKPIMWGALALTLAATVWLSSQDNGDIEPVVRDGDQASRQRSASGSDSKRSSATSRGNQTGAQGGKPANNQATDEALAQSLNAWLKQRVSNGNDVDNSTTDANNTNTPTPWPRAAMNAWASQSPPPPPPPSVVKPLPPPPPRAPQFAYQWVGRYVDTASRAVIAGPSQTWVVAQGDVIEREWRVESIGERQMTLMYLPLQQTQTVSMK